MHRQSISTGLRAHTSSASSSALIHSMLDARGRPRSETNTIRHRKRKFFPSKTLKCQPVSICEISLHGNGIKKEPDSVWTKRPQSSALACVCTSSIKPKRKTDTHTKKNAHTVSRHGCFLLNTHVRCDCGWACMCVCVCKVH